MAASEKCSAGSCRGKTDNLHTGYQRRAVPVRTDLQPDTTTTRSTARCRAARFPGFGTEIADSRAVSLWSGGTRHGSFTIEEFREGMRRRRHGLVRYEAQNWVRQSAHLENYARITWFKLGFWDCLG